MEGSLPVKNQLDSSSRFDTIPTCGRRTDGDSIYRASIASRGKNRMFGSELNIIADGML